MATPRNRRTAKTPPPCPVCSGSKQVAVPVRVGRRRRNVGQQEGICLGCFGTGLATELDSK